jgi:hypothetical protein
MSRTLPPRPDFTQLKHQAKDLLRAHERKDASCCATLRRLRQFASADDADVLAGPLALHEAQYALAMEYGFASWNALKRHVEKATGRPNRVRREKDRTYIPGLDKHPIGNDGLHEHCFIAALQGVMKTLGEDFSYAYLMGASGAAFQVQIHQPDWCPSAACAGVGYNIIPEAMKVTGYRLTSIPVHHDADVQAAIVRAEPLVQASVERGVPVIHGSGNNSLIVGFCDDGKRILRQYSGGEGYKETSEWPWWLGIIEPHDVPIPRHQAVMNSLRLAVMLARSERFGEYLSGFAALKTWADQLLDESRFAGLDDKTWFRPAHANGYCFGCLWACRRSAAAYLDEIAADYDAPIRSQLAEIARQYHQMHDILGRSRPEFACAWSLMPWRIGGVNKWTPAMRRVQAEILREVLELERRAVAKIQEVLQAMEPSPARPS